jgi:hypothetical protein
MVVAILTFVFYLRYLGVLGIPITLTLFATARSILYLLLFKQVFPLHLLHFFKNFFFPLGICIFSLSGPIVIKFLLFFGKAPHGRLNALGILIPAFIVYLILVGLLSLGCGILSLRELREIFGRKDYPESS